VSRHACIESEIDQRDCRRDRRVRSKLYEDQRSGSRERVRGRGKSANSAVSRIGVDGEARSQGSRRVVAREHDIRVGRRYRELKCGDRRTLNTREQDGHGNLLANARRHIGDGHRDLGGCEGDREAAGDNR